MKNAFTIILNRWIQYIQYSIPNEILSQIFDFIQDKKTTPFHLTILPLPKIYPSYPKIDSMITYRLLHPISCKKIGITFSRRGRFCANNYYLYKLNSNSQYFKHIDYYDVNIMYHNKKLIYHYGNGKSANLNNEYIEEENYSDDENEDIHMWVFDVSSMM